MYVAQGNDTRAKRSICRYQYSLRIRFSNNCGGSPRTVSAWPLMACPRARPATSAEASSAVFSHKDVTGVDAEPANFRFSGDVVAAANTLSKSARLCPAWINKVRHLGRRF